MTRDQYNDKILDHLWLVYLWVNDHYQAKHGNMSDQVKDSYRNLFEGMWQAYLQWYEEFGEEHPDTRDVVVED